jgi:outer membrane protein assembly factor BamB
MNVKRVAFVLVACFAILAWSTANAYETFLGPTGVIKWDKAKACSGYTIFGPQYSKDIYLIDMEGNVVHKWKTSLENCEYVQLLPNGNVLRGAKDPGKLAVYFGGASGLLQELDWDGKVVWEYKLNSPKGIFHHGFDRMANGNTLLTAWEQYSWDEAIAKGRNPKTTYPKGAPNPLDPEKKPTQGIWADMIQEVDKNGKVVWEWRAWDHIGTGPDQIDINYTLPAALSPTYAGPDWGHGNTVQGLDNDRVLFCSRNFGEIYIIDKKTGKIAFRWGNPSTHGKGRAPGGYMDDGDQILFGPHHPTMQPNGNITIFDNGTFRPTGNYSRVIEMDPGTGKIVWEFKAKGAPRQPGAFYTSFQGAVQKLPNGNFLVTSTQEGHLFEVTPDKQIVWEFQNPIGNKGPVCTREDYQIAFWVHRSYRYASDYPGLKGKDLTPKGPLAPGCPDFRKVLEEGTAKNPK